jgi:hypothetical protein
MSGACAITNKTVDGVDPYSETAMEELEKLGFDEEEEDITEDKNGATCVNINYKPISSPSDMCKSKLFLFILSSIMLCSVGRIHDNGRWGRFTTPFAFSIGLLFRFTCVCCGRNMAPHQKI